MMLRFFARPGHILRPPGDKPKGQFVPAVGRGKRATELGIEMPALQVPTECDSGDQLGKRISRMCLQTPDDPPVWAADHDTATALGIKYVPIEFKDGEYHPQPPLKAPEPTKKSGGDK